MRFTDPSSGRPYEVGPDGHAYWVDETARTDGRTAVHPWYRRVRAVAPLAALAGFVLGSGLSSAATTGTATGTTAGVAATVTATVTPGSPAATSATRAATPPAPTAAAPRVTVTRPAAVRTVRVTATRPVRVTVTRTVRAAAADPGGGDGLDPHFGTCKEAKAEGYGPYRAGADPEYEWYTDRDRDGIVCE